MDFKINTKVKIKGSELKGNVKAIFENYEEYCNTDISTCQKKKDFLKQHEKPYTKEELKEIQYSVEWDDDGGVSLHPESELQATRAIYTIDLLLIFEQNYENESYIKQDISNKIYQVGSYFFEKIGEQKGYLRGNGHHMAQELCVEALDIWDNHVK